MNPDHIRKKVEENKKDDTINNTLEDLCLSWSIFSSVFSFSIKNFNTHIFAFFHFKNILSAKYLTYNI